ncbi:hypothetical protein AB4Y42_34585 [Paraburkholderia sp. EG286B]|uniref:hypothetical protein n=1 Tax=Paraburkholderia sp. EG286B TaxID=3237011 RepID=UPI0034D15C04
MDRKPDPIAELVIDGLNGTCAVAELCEISPAAVSMWRHAGIPKPRLQFLKLARPDFDWTRVPSDYPLRAVAPTE